jgi:hypothetical protein
MKKLTVEIADETHTELVKEVAVRHLSDLSEGVKDAVEDFVELNAGAVIPPVNIRVEEKDEGEKKRKQSR